MSKHTEKKSNAESGNNPVNILYVVLHGLISLVDVGGSGFIAYALEMGDDHRYLYGNWLTEHEIPQRQQGAQPLIAELTGVDPGTATLDTSKDVILKSVTAPDVDHQDVRAVFRLPRPLKIHYLVPGKLPAGNLQGDVNRVVGKPTALSGLRVFEYTFAESGKVHLTQASGTTPLWLCPGPVPVKSQNFKLSVLHIYDQPGEELLGHLKHTKDEFKKSAAFLGADLSLDQAVKTTTDPIIPLPGMLMGETVCLSRREDAVLNILATDREGVAPNPGTGGCSGTGVCAACGAQGG